MAQAENRKDQTGQFFKNPPQCNNTILNRYSKILNVYINECSLIKNITNSVFDQIVVKIGEYQCLAQNTNSNLVFSS